MKRLSRRTSKTLASVMAVLMMLSSMTTPVLAATEAAEQETEQSTAAAVSWDEKIAELQTKAEEIDPAAENAAEKIEEIRGQLAVITASITLEYESGLIGDEAYTAYEDSVAALEAYLDSILEEPDEEEEPVPDEDSGEEAPSAYNVQSVLEEIAALQSVFEAIGAEAENAESQYTEINDQLTLIISASVQAYEEEKITQEEYAQINEAASALQTSVENALTPVEETPAPAEELPAYDVQAALDAIAALQADAEALDPEDETIADLCADLYDEAMEVYDEAFAAFEADEITEEQYLEVENGTAAIFAYLKSEYGYDPYAIAMYAPPGGDWNPGGSTSTGTAKKDGQSETFNSNHYYHIDILVEGHYDYDFTYTSAASNQAELVISKEWEGDDASTRPDEVNVTVLRNTEGSAAAYYTTVTLTADGGWTDTISVPIADDSDEPYIYSLTDSVIGYASTSTTATFTLSDASYTTYTDAAYGSIDFYHDSTAPKIVIRQADGTTTTLEDWSRSGDVSTASVTVDSLTGTWSYDHTDGTYSYSTEETMTVESIDYVTYTNIDGQRTILYANSSERTMADLDANGNGTLDDFPVTEQKEGSAYYRPDPDYFLYYEQDDTNRDEFTQEFWSSNRAIRDMGTSPVIAVGYDYTYTVLNEFGVVEEKLSSTSQTVNTASTSYSNYCGNANTRGTQRGFDVILKNTDLNSASDEYSASDEVVLTNTYDSLTSVTVSKTWVHNNNPNPPESLVVYLLADGVRVDSYTLTGPDWSHTFTGLDKFNASGRAIVYTMEEELVPNYAITGNEPLHLTNTYDPALTSVKVNKVWADTGVPHPESVAVTLYANGHALTSTVLSENNNWSHEFTNLLVVDDEGNAIEYTVQETTPAGYEATITGDAANGFEITNTLMPVEVPVTKIWNDNGDRYGIRPESITVKLLANGNEKDTAVLNAGNSWSHTFTDLPAADSNGSISYTVQEVAVPGYDTTIDGYTITNTLITTSVAGVKIWNDESNRDGIRPDSITLELYADGAATGRTLVVSDVNNTDADSWNYRFDGLPKYNQNNEEIKYTVVEVPVANYTTTYSTDGLTVTNTYVPQKTSITAKKIWAGIPASVEQPFSVTVALYGNNTLIEKDVVLSASNNWTYSWTNLSLNEGGIPISYRVYETHINYTDGSVAPANSQYEVTYKYDEQAENTINITNTYSPETTSLTVAKRWDDDNNAEGFRPEGVTIGLYGNGELVTLADGTSNPIVLNEGKYWAHTFTHLPINDEFNNPITYEIFELENGQPIADGGTLAQGTGTADDYTVSYGTTDDGHLTITNSNTIEYVRIVGEKVWDDANDFDGLRPEEVIIKLYADGGLYNHVHITEKENWVYLFDNLPKYKDGQEVVYTVTETIDGVELKQGDEIDVNGDKVMDYVVTSLGLNRIVNTHTVEYVNITGGKIWNDDYDRDGYRPNSITLELYKTVDGTKELVDTATATSSGNWQFAFSHLPKYEDGVEIEYSVEERAVAGYKSVVTVTKFEGDQYYVITNTHIPDTTSITVKKTWVDGESSSRPSDITLILYADNAKYREVTITADDNWSYTFTNLPKNAAGKVNTPIVYTVKEAAVSGYSVVYDGFSITNIQTTSVSGSKIWKDADDQDGKRPASITVNLFADGSRIASDEITAADGWKYTFSDLPKYDAETGKLIAYTVTEDGVSGYSTSINGYNITNTHTPELITIRGEKHWADNSNQDGIRPGTITLNLLADGVVVRTMTLTNAEGSEENTWPFQFENLPKYKDGVEIKYTVTENTVANYDASYSEDTLTITNTHKPAVTSLTVEKAWNDNENQDNTRPGEITVTLYKSSASRTMEKVTVDADGNPIQNPVAIKAESGWKYTFTNLPKFANGTEIVYYAEESEDGLGGYVAHYQNNGDGTFTITNTRAETTTITVQKKWNDAENQDGVRPSEVVVALYKNGVQDGDPITLNEANSWYGEWKNKDVFDDEGKHRIEYHVKELDAQGNPVAEGGKIGNYTVSYEEGAMSADHVIVNSYTPQLISIEGEKTWEDDNNRDGLRPTSIKVTLLADGSEIAHLHPSAETNWKYTFHNLPKYKDQGTEIVYTIAEDAISGYTTTINGYNITNTHIPAATSIEVKKFWNDNSDQDGVRPESITIKLLADGTVVKTMELKAPGTDGNEWSCTFEGLPKYQNGKEIVYTVAEDTVDGYDTIVSGYNITNTHIPETITIEGEKLWDDNNDQDGIRPGSITIQLLADGTVVRTVHVTGANGSDANKWSYTFEDLPKYRNGKEISYTVKEPAVPGYTATISGYTVTNIHKPEVVDITANKIWDDDNDIASLRPESVTFTLFADGVKYGDAVALNEQNQWSYTWNDLAKYSSGKEIVYTVREEEVEHYITGIPNGVNITNTLKKTEIEIRKIWDDDDDQKGKRPSSITVELLRGSTVENTITLTEQDGWVKSFIWYGETDDLSVREINVPSCYCAVESQLILDTDGYCFTITNVYVEEDEEDPEDEDEDEDESEDVTVKKVWVGGDKSDRPAVKIRLYKDGKAYRTITLSDGKWRHVWEEISDDEDIEWSVEELDVPDGYVSSIRQVSDTYFVVTNTWDEEENRYTGV